MRRVIVDYNPSGPLEQAIGKVTIIPGNLNLLGRLARVNI
jgi:hypothetical protein